MLGHLVALVPKCDDYREKFKSIQIVMEPGHQLRHEGLSKQCVNSVRVSMMRPR